MPLLAWIAARRVEDMAEDIEIQLSQRIVTSPWFAIQCDVRVCDDIKNTAVLLVFV